MGTGAAIGSAVFWGFMPIYWQMLRPIESSVIIFYRIVLVAVVCFVFAWIYYGKDRIIAPFKNKKIVLRYILAGLLITTNWSIYIWAVNAEHVIQTCIGYYIEPLMVCIFGIIFFKEKVTKSKVFALAMAGLGVVVLLIHFGEVPIIALSIALTFATYAAIKKHLNVESMLSLTFETMFLMPPALIVIIWMEVNGVGAANAGSGHQYALLFLCGLFTAIPLGLFGVAANKVPLVTLGIIEYVSPSISLIIGIFLFREPFDAVQFTAFAIVWVGLVVFTIGEMKEMKKNETATGNKNMDNSEFLNILNTRDRFEMPPKVFRVTAGHGGEVYLIMGSEFTAMYDAGMQYCGPQLIKNAEAVLCGRDLDYLLLSHSHYDHIGATPFVRRRWPNVTTCGSEHAEYILKRPGALKEIRRLSENAAKDYGNPDAEITTEGLRIDRVLREGESISLGDISVTCYEGKGHTDCSLMYMIEPEKILFLSESTGVIEFDGAMHPAILKSYRDSLATLQKCRELSARTLISPHYGVIPEMYNDLYFDRYELSVQRERNLIVGMHEEGASFEEILEAHKDVYWREDRSKEQPEEAYEVNVRSTIKAYIDEAQ